MRLIILADGNGERALRSARDRPLSPADSGGPALLDEQLQSAEQSGGIDDVVIVTGYRADQLEEQVCADHRRALLVRTLFNPFHDVSASLMSLWIARNELAEDALVMAGDKLFAPEVLAAAGNAERGVYLAVCAQETDDEARVRLDDGLVASVSAACDDQPTSVMSPGLALVRGRRARTLVRDHLDRLARDAGALMRGWVELVNRMWLAGTPVRPWWVAADDWYEVAERPGLHPVPTGRRTAGARLSTSIH